MSEVGELDGVTTFCELAVPLAVRIAEKLGLPHNSPDSIDFARDKVGRGGGGARSRGRTHEAPCYGAALFFNHLCVWVTQAHPHPGACAGGLSSGLVSTLSSQTQHENVQLCSKMTQPLPGAS